MTFEWQLALTGPLNNKLLHAGEPNWICLKKNKAGFRDKAEFCEETSLRLVLRYAFLQCQEAVQNFWWCNILLASKVAKATHWEVVDGIYTLSRGTHACTYTRPETNLIILSADATKVNGGGEGNAICERSYALCRAAVLCLAGASRTITFARAQKHTCFNLGPPMGYRFGGSQKRRQVRASSASGWCPTGDFHIAFPSCAPNIPIISTLGWPTIVKRTALPWEQKVERGPPNIRIYRLTFEALQ